MSDHSEHEIVVDGDSTSTPAAEPITTGPETPNTHVVDDLREMDDIDTDDLLDEADQALKPIVASSNRNSSRATTSRRRSARARKPRSTEDMDLDEYSGSETKRRTRRKAGTKKSTKANNNKPDKGKKPQPRKAIFDPDYVRQLAAEYPDEYWQFHADSGYSMIHTINEEHPLQPVPSNITDQAPITSMTLSADGTLLATFSNIGAVKIWDIERDFRLVRKLRDTEETNIDEFYCGKFASDSQELLVTGGKLKDRHRWSAQDEDNHILHCPIKIFNIEEAKVVGKLEGHEEEILCIKTVKFKGENYYISTSQDGYITKWKMKEDWTTLVESTRMEDGITCMAFTVSFLPNTGNKYFLAACDGHLRLYDFEEAQLMQTFEDMYSSYCDCGKFVTWLDEPREEAAAAAATEEDEIDIDRMDEDPIPEQQQQQQQQQQTNNKEPYAYFISRGAEMCDVDEGVSSIPNTCTLHKLIYPTESGGQFRLETVKKYKHDDYHSNSWLVKITSNGRYLLAPTIYGQIFVFNMATGQVTAILKEHEDMEVRDVIFHPYRPLIFSSGDDGFVKVYTYKSDATDVGMKDA